MADESGIATWSVVLATLAGPVLAIQVQKIIERLGEDKKRRLGIFETLLSTQSRRLQIEHVAALNMIHIVFRKKGDKHILDAWKEYLNHLRTDSLRNFSAWQAKSDELMRNLLWEMAKIVNYSGNKDDLRLSDYTPDQYFIREDRDIAVKKLLLDALNGERVIKIEVIGSNDGNELRDNLAKALSGGKLSVEIKEQGKFID